jgi:hypothetical protein
LPRASRWAIAALLDGFAAEFGDPTPGLELLAARVESAITSGEVVALLADDPPVGVASTAVRNAASDLLAGASTAGPHARALDDHRLSRSCRHGRSLLREEQERHGVLPDRADRVPMRAVARRSRDIIGARRAHRREALVRVDRCN